MLFRVTFIDASHDVNSCKKQLSIDLNVQLILECSLKYI